MKKRIILAVLLIAALLTLTACGNNVEGTWKLKSGALIDLPMGGTSLADMVSITMTLKSGKLTMSAGGAQTMGLGFSVETTYKTQGNKITIDPITAFGTTGQSVTYEYKVDGDTLTFTGDGKTIVFEKQK